MSNKNPKILFEQWLKAPIEELSDVELKTLWEKLTLCHTNWWKYAAVGDEIARRSARVAPVEESKQRELDLVEV